MLHQIAPQYIDTGKAKVVYRHMAFIGNESQWAGEASECANEQSKFWPFADYIFKHQAGENQGALSKENLKKFAADVGLDTAPFNTCLDSGKYAGVVKQDTAEGQQRGVNSTPTFFINQERFVGIMSAQQFGNIINSLAR